MTTTSSDMLAMQVTEIVLRIMGERAPDDLAKDASLTSAGMSSLDMVNLLIQLETDFGITIPPRMVTAQSFRSVNAIAELVCKQTAGMAA